MEDILDAARAFAGGFARANSVPIDRLSQADLRAVVAPCEGILLGTDKSLPQSDVRDGVHGRSWTGWLSNVGIPTPTTTGSKS